MQRDILASLAIPEEGVVRAGLLRDNLRLSVSRDMDRQSALLDLLTKDRRFSAGSVRPSLCSGPRALMVGVMMATWRKGGKGGLGYNSWRIRCGVGVV
eukprot:2513397-Rhodomonas_salina.1